MQSFFGIQRIFLVILVGNWYINDRKDKCGEKIRHAKKANCIACARLTAICPVVDLTLRSAIKQ